MAFKTKEEMFGDGAGFGAAVPYSTSNPPGTGAGNRGVQFGEQVTAAIANRTHYALILNDEDLNARLAVFETGGLDAAYDNGAVGPSGGGRQITKDGGAIETSSALPSIYDEDILNSHFRANQVGDVVKGGGGFESVSYGRSGNAALFGFLDRRAMNLTGYTVIADTIAASITGSTITVGAGQLKDGSNNTHLVMGLDLIEILSGPHAGVYVISSLSSGTAASVLAVDGTAPTFAAGSPNVRILRPTFGTFNRYGAIGTHNLQTTTVAGLAGHESALDVVPGSTLGRYEGSGTSPDGARYAIRVQWKQLNGTLATKLSVDAQGQLRSAVTRSQLTTAQRSNSAELGAPAAIVQQDDPGGTVETETGFFVRSNGTLQRWFGFVAAGDMRPATTTSGSFTFDFINTLGYNVDITDVTHADWGVAPGVSLVEILTPSPQAGIYLVDLRDSNNGRMTLVDLDGQAVSFPSSGAGTMRFLFTATLGARNYDVNISFFTGLDTEGRATAVFESPATDGSACLVLNAYNQNAIAPEFHLIRGMTTADGGTLETFAVTGLGRVGGRDFTAFSGEHSAFSYRTAPTRRFAIPLSAGREVRDIAGANPEWRFATSGEAPLNASLADDGLIYFALNEHLREGMVITDVRVIVDPGAVRAGANRMRVGLYYRASDFGTPASNPIALTTLATAFDNGTTATQQLITLASGLGAGHTVAKDSLATPREYYIIVKAGNTGAASVDIIYGIQIVVTDPGPRNI